MWFNLNSNLAENTPAKGSCLTKIWEDYFAAFGKASNVSAISPISWYGDKNGEKGNVDKCAHYVTPGTFAVTVNPGKYVFDGVAGDGVVVGTMQCNENNTDPVNVSGKEVFPLIVWLDPTK